MAKVKLIRKNFTDFISQNMDKIGVEGMFMNALMGGKAKEMIQDLPDEQIIRIDTNHVVAVGQLTKMKETGDVVFQLFFDCNHPKMQNIWIKGDDKIYADFLRVWAEEKIVLTEGEYVVAPDGYAISKEDGKKIVVYPRKDFV